MERVNIEVIDEAVILPGPATGYAGTTDPHDGEKLHRSARRDLEQRAAMGGGGSGRSSLWGAGDVMCPETGT